MIRSYFELNSKSLLRVGKQHSKGRQRNYGKKRNTFELNWEYFVCPLVHTQCIDLIRRGNQSGEIVDG